MASSDSTDGLGSALSRLGLRMNSPASAGGAPGGGAGGLSSAAASVGHGVRGGMPSDNRPTGASESGRRPLFAENTTVMGGIGSSLTDQTGGSPRNPNPLQAPPHFNTGGHPAGAPQYEGDGGGRLYDPMSGMPRPNTTYEGSGLTGSARPTLGQQQGTYANLTPGVSFASGVSATSPGGAGSNGGADSCHHGTYPPRSPPRVETVKEEDDDDDIGSIQDSRSYEMVNGKKLSPPYSNGVPKVVLTDSSSVDSKLSPMRTIEYLPSDLNDYSKVCRGIIAKHGATMCVVKNCTKTHRGEKPATGVKPGDVFIVHSPNKSVLLHPRLSSSTVDSSLIGEWMGIKKRSEEWVTLFDQVLRASEFCMPVTKEVLIQMEEEEREDLAFKTPRTKNKRPFEETIGAIGINPYVSKNIDPEEMESLSPKEQLDKVRDAVGDLDSGVGELGSQSVKFAQAIKVIARDQDALGRIMNNKFAVIHRELGTKSKVAMDELGAPDIWTSLAVIASRPFYDADGKPPSSVLSREESKVRMEDLYNVARAESQPLKSSIERIEESLKSSVIQINKAIHAAGCRLDAVEGSRSLAPVKEESNDQLMYQSLQELHLKISDVDGAVGRIRMGEKAGVTKFGDTGIDSREKAAAWIESNIATSDVGLFVTPHIILEHIYAKMEGDGFMKNFLMLHRLDLENRQQGYAMTSFEKAIPKVLSMKDDTAITDDASYFDRAKTWKDWNLHETGIRARLKVRLSEVERGIKRSIESSLKSGSPAFILATHFLITSVAWVEGGLKFLDDFMEYLTACKFSEKKAWHISTRLFHRLVSAIFEPCVGVLDSFKTKDLMQVSSSILYANLQAIDIAEQIRNDRFANSPLVAGELSKFVVVNTGFDAIEKMQLKIEQLKDEVNSAKKEAEAAKKSAVTACNRADEVKIALDALTKRVKTVENSPKLR